MTDTREVCALTRQIADLVGALERQGDRADALRAAIEQLQAAVEALAPRDMERTTAALLPPGDLAEPALKRRMRQRGVTQHHVARVCGVDRTMVNKVINGRAVSARVLQAIRDLLATRGQRSA
jgi:predicted XRE-type DNA-binding protein